MLEVENFISSNGITAHNRVSIQQGSHKVVTHARLTIIDGELRIDNQRPSILVLYGTIGHVT